MTPPAPLTPFFANHATMRLTDGLAWQRFQILAADARYARNWHHSGPTEAAAFPTEGLDLVFDERRGFSRDFIWSGDGLVVHGSFLDNATNVTVASRQPIEGSPLATSIEGHLASFAPRKSTTKFHLWRSSGNGPVMWLRDIATPTWADIRGNYASRVRAGLDDLMDATLTDDSGRLVLWHGEPGTGKTTAIRALARSWSRQCDVHLITDPEAFFWETDYLVEVVSRAGTARRMVIIAEDTDEFLQARTGAHPGASLSRLLNLTDGILGQGLGITVLLTTNTPVDRLHPAVGRPGRCLANIEFTRMDAAEAAAWLGQASRGSSTLAELYLARGDLQQSSVVREPVRVGTYL